MAVLESPAADGTLIDKKPTIRIRFHVPVSHEAFLVLLDGSDVTQIARWHAQGFELTPVDPLASGVHALVIKGMLPDGTPLLSQFSIATRQSDLFADLASRNNLTLNHSTLLLHEGPARHPAWRLDGNLTSDSHLQQGPWQVDLKATGRSVSQEGQPTGPEREQPDLTNILLKTAYSREQLELATEIGDTLVDESQLSVSHLARRGGKVSAQVGPVTVNGFAVRSREEYGLDDPQQNINQRLGIATQLGETEVQTIGTTNADDDILGTSAEVAFFEKRARLKGIYASGGENGSCFGTSTSLPPAEGSVAAMLLATDFFERRLATEFEAGRSDYDADGSGAMRSTRDEAWRVRVKGGLGRAFYEAGYGYVGPGYQVVANPLIVRDQRGPILSGGTSLGDHTLSVTLTQTEDNLDDQPLYAVTETRAAQANYAYNGIATLPLTLGYMLSDARSRDEPDPLAKTELVTDMLLATAAYTLEWLTLSTQASISRQDDRTATDMDTTAWSAALLPSLQLGSFFATTGYALNRIQDHSSGIDTDTHTLILDLQGDLLDGSWWTNCSTTLDFTRSDMSANDRDGVSADLQIAYRVRWPSLRWLEPLVGVRLIWLASDGAGARGEEDELALMLTLSTSTMLQR
jgi:hypothetical protein